MQLNLKKASIRQVAAISSLVIIALALPIGVYLTQETQNLQKLATNFPITPPDYCAPPPSCEPGELIVYGSSQDPQACPIYECVFVPPPPSSPPSPSPYPNNILTDDIYIQSIDLQFTDLNGNVLNEIQGTPGSPVKYTITVNIQNTNKTTIIPQNNPGNEDLDDIAVIETLNGSGHSSTSFNYNDLVRSAQGLSVTFDHYSGLDTPYIDFGIVIDPQGKINDRYFFNNVWSRTHMYQIPLPPSPSPSPSPALVNKFDINEDGQINILDYAAFITGFIAGLSQ